MLALCPHMSLCPCPCVWCLPCSSTGQWLLTCPPVEARLDQLGAAPQPLHLAGSCTGKAQSHGEQLCPWWYWQHPSGQCWGAVALCWSADTAAIGTCPSCFLWLLVSLTWLFVTFPTLGKPCGLGVMGSRCSPLCQPGLEMNQHTRGRGEGGNPFGTRAGCWLPVIPPPSCPWLPEDVPFASPLGFPSPAALPAVQVSQGLPAPGQVPAPVSCC